MQGTPYTNYGLHSTPPPKQHAWDPIIQVLPQTGGKAVCNFTFPKSLRNPSNSAKGSDHCHSSDYMKQQWETERYAAAHRDRIPHRYPIIISDCNLRTYTSRATRTSFQWQPKTYNTILQQRRPTWTKRKIFYNLLNTHTSDNIKCHEIYLVGGQFNTKLA